MFGSTHNYRETKYLYADTGIIPLGADLARHSFEAALFWLNFRLQLRVAVAYPGVTPSAQTQKTVTISMDETATTVEVWSFARLAILVATQLPFQVSEVLEGNDGIKSFPLHHCFNDQSAPVCPVCNLVLRRAGQAFPVGVVVRCPGCGGMMVSRGERVDYKKGST